MQNTTQAFSFTGAGAPQLYARGGSGLVTGAVLERCPELTVPELGASFVVPWWCGPGILGVPDANADGTCMRPTPGTELPDGAGRTLPLWFRTDTGPGCFAVTAELFAERPCADALLFVSRRRLAWRGALQAGQSVTVTALCDVSPIYAAGSLCKVESVDVALVGDGVRLRGVTVAPADVPRLCLMGDSTVTDQNSPVPYAPGACYAGWGQMMPLYVGAQYCVSNHAHSGLSTETFRNEGHYENLCALLRPGDMVLIQFGHNDQKWKHLAADTGYRANLLRYLDELRVLGAAPVLVTPLARNTWKDAQTYNDLLADNARVVLELAAQESLPAVDLHAWMMRGIQADGMDASRRWYHPCDYTHLNDFGAYRVAGFVAGELRRLGLLDGARPWPAEWAPCGPMEVLEPPQDWEQRGLVRPESDKPLVDYGMIAEFPWPIQ